ncbi:hypothetical protein FGO68_gene1441 [Halteria grandinella]|uniref:Uncharacterized protein n=1 Tax=Halteria grandinella TaxID=5974 RepID=A0A8J8NZM5_HALGN|nr:hypothetical protein FGO68_gene1441 [Halteria grandinella]
MTRNLFIKFQVPFINKLSILQLKYFPINNYNFPKICNRRVWLLIFQYTPYPILLNLDNVRLSFSPYSYHTLIKCPTLYNFVYNC